MADPPTQSVADPTDDLFDRYTLPKIALAVILAASLIGTWVTVTFAGGTVFDAVAKWAYFVALGVLTGGLLWKHTFVRPADLSTEADAYCAEMYDRFERIAAGALAVLAISGSVVFAEYVGRISTDLVFSFGMGVLALVALGVMIIWRNGSVTDQFRHPLGLLALGVALALVAITALAEVALRGFDPVAGLVRILHLLAFAVWVGGAVWNIFVAVPTGQKRPTVAVVRAAGQQLERFRWAVRFVIPTILLTGVYQAVDALGTTLTGYLGTIVGLAILAKVGFIGLLVVIFKLCPMWRACSPIEGVCELEDLGGSVPADTEPGNRDGDAEVANSD
ncbi:hypothetical protein [Haloarcula rubripromontorii]|uniref:hypothetical protein n=1 Tax=Haloarcula rubripromontorii TaxID=1705562 RepID=UPI00345B89BF